MKLSVLSWNIWQGNHLQEIISFLRDHDPDIIALQEVIEKDGTNTAEQIASELGYNQAYYRAINKTRLGYPQGNAVLSKHEIIDNQCHFLSDKSQYQDTAETEPRIAVEVKIDFDGQVVSVFTTHLAYSHKFQKSDMRESQIKNLLKILPNSQVILMGDFNSHPEDSTVKLVEEAMIDADKNPKEPTWTVYPFDYEGFQENELRHRLDYIFVSSDLKTENFRIGDSKGSDHLPVSAEISFK